MAYKRRSLKGRNKFLPKKPKALPQSSSPGKWADKIKRVPKKQTKPVPRPKPKSIPKDHPRRIQKPKKLDDTGRWSSDIKRVPKGKPSGKYKKKPTKPKSLPKRTLPHDDGYGGYARGGSKYKAGT